MQSTGRLKRLHKDIEIANSKGQICYPVNDSLVHLNAVIHGPAGSPYEGGIFNINIRIPDRYPFDPPKCEFVTKVYHPNIDDMGRICLSVLKSKPQGDWSPAQNLSTILDSLIILLGNPNPEDPLVTDIANEYTASKELFLLKAKDFTKRYAKGDQHHIVRSAASTAQNQTPAHGTTSRSSSALENSDQDYSLSHLQRQQDQKPKEFEKKRLKLSRPLTKRGGDNAGREDTPTLMMTDGEESNREKPLGPLSLVPPQKPRTKWNTDTGTEGSIMNDHSYTAGSIGDGNNGRPVESDIVEPASMQVDGACEKHVAVLPSGSSSLQSAVGDASSSMSTMKITWDERLSEAPRKSKSSLQLSRKRARLHDDGARRATLTDHDVSISTAHQIVLDQPSTHTPSTAVSGPTTLSSLGTEDNKTKKDKANNNSSLEKDLSEVTRGDDTDILTPLRILKERRPENANTHGGPHPTKVKASKKNHLTEMKGRVGKEKDKQSSKQEDKFDTMEENERISSVEDDLEEKPAFVSDSVPVSISAPETLSFISSSISSAVSSETDCVDVSSRHPLATMHSEQESAAKEPFMIVTDDGEDLAPMKNDQLVRDSSPMLSSGPLLGTVTTMDDSSGMDTLPLPLHASPPITPVSTSTPFYPLAPYLPCTTEQSSSLATPSSVLSSSSSPSLILSNDNACPPSPTSSLPAAVTIKSPSSFLAARSTEEIFQVARKRDLMKKKKRAVIA